MSRILVIDDDPEVRTFIESLLLDAGYDAIAAEEGAAGLALHRAEPFDLVITDMLMPEKDGIELIRILRSDYPDVPIVAISSGGTKGSPVHLKTAKLLGADATLQKPIKREALLAAVEPLLKL